MFELRTWQDTPYFFGLLMHRTYPLLGVFNTWDDAASYAFNVCGFTDCNYFFINGEPITDWASFCEQWNVARFATSPDGSVVACSFKPLKGD